MFSYELAHLSCTGGGCMLIGLPGLIFSTKRVFWENRENTPIFLHHELLVLLLLFIKTKQNNLSPNMWQLRFTTP